MAPIDRRVRLWAWMVHRQGSIASRSEAEVIALQARHTPDNALTNRIFGAVAPGTVVKDRTIPGPGGDITVRVYRPVRPNSGARPLIVYRPNCVRSRPPRSSSRPGPWPRRSTAGESPAPRQAQ